MKAIVFLSIVSLFVSYLVVSVSVFLFIFFSKLCDFDLLLFFSVFNVQCNDNVVKVLPQFILLKIFYFGYDVECMFVVHVALLTLNSIGTMYFEKVDKNSILRLKAKKNLDHIIQFGRELFI